MQRQNSQEYSSLKIIHPATSYITATFHPNIGQHAHQYLSNTATYELGIIPQGIRVKAGLHIAKEHKSAKPPQWGGSVAERLMSTLAYG